MESTGRKLTGTQRTILGLALLPMVAVGIAGGIGTYSNISAAYGEGTAIGALAAGEGATAVLAMILLGVTLLGQSAPALIRVGLWVLPAIAAVMGATAATEGVGQTIVYAATPMAMTAAAEGLAFLARRIVVHQEGRDVEAEARAASVVRDLAYHQARAAAHPSKRVRKASVRRSWRLAAKVGEGDVSLGADLLDVQRARLTQGADIALERLFTASLSGTASVLTAVSADTPLALPAASADELVDSRTHEPAIRTDAHGHPYQTTSDQPEEGEGVGPDLHLVGADKPKKGSMRADVRSMVADGVQDVCHVIDAMATRHGRDPKDRTFRGTVTKYVREVKTELEAADAADDVRPGQYL